MRIVIREQAGFSPLRVRLISLSREEIFSKKESNDNAPLEHPPLLAIGILVLGDKSRGK